MARDKTGASRRKRPVDTRLPASFLFRVVLLASVAVVGSIWALVRYYTHPRQPMMVAAPASGTVGAWDAGAGFVEIEVAPR